MSISLVLKNTVESQTEYLYDFIIFCWYFIIQCMVKQDRIQKLYENVGRLRFSGE